MATPTALVLRNYHCRKSEMFAYWLAEHFDSDRYQGVVIDPNEGLAGPRDGWYTAFKSLTSRGVYMIALLTSALSSAPDEEDESFKGIALLSELLHFWNQGPGNEARPDRSLLIPVFLDCRPDDLARPIGRHEQLQDIAIPLILECQPFYVNTTTFFTNGCEIRSFVDALAIRMNAKSS